MKSRKEKTPTSIQEEENTAEPHHEAATSFAQNFKIDYMHNEKTDRC